MQRDLLLRGCFIHLIFTGLFVGIWFFLHQSNVIYLQNYAIKDLFAFEEFNNQQGYNLNFFDIMTAGKFLILGMRHRRAEEHRGQESKAKERSGGRMHLYSGVTLPLPYPLHTNRSTAEEAWTWLEGPFYRGVYSTTKENGLPKTEAERSSVVMYDRVIGKIRLRQLRVREDSCSMSDPKIRTIDGLCFDEFARAGAVWFYGASEEKRPWKGAITNRSYEYTANCCSK